MNFLRREGSAQIFQRLDRGAVKLVNDISRAQAGVQASELRRNGRHGDTGKAPQSRQNRVDLPVDREGQDSQLANQVIVAVGKLDQIGLRRRPLEDRDRFLNLLFSALDV